MTPTEKNDRLWRKPWITAPFHGPVEVTVFGDVRPPAGMVPAYVILRNDVGPAFQIDPTIAAELR